MRGGLQPVRRAMLCGALAAVLPRRTPAALSNSDAMRLEEASRDATKYRELGGGVRVLDLIEGDGRRPKAGERVYIHFKIWAGGFDRGVPADASYFDVRPIGYVLGQPSGRVVRGIDAGVAGMAEGGWRRMVVPAALGYADAGLPRTATRSKISIAPGADLYVDVRLMDGGSGRHAAWNYAAVPSDCRYRFDEQCLWICAVLLSYRPCPRRHNPNRSRIA